jgi:hypothetical protein
MAKKDTIDLSIPQQPTLVGVDCGTMNLVSAHTDNDGDVVTKRIRNMYLEIQKSGINLSDLSQMDYVESDDEIYVIGEDAFRFANIFGSAVKRPMQKGLIAADNVDAMDVLALIMEQLIGKTDNGVCVYSVPAPSIDKHNDILFHENVFKRIFNELGYKAVPFNEAMGIVYSECGEEQFTALSFSYGAGMSNVALSYKGNQVSAFSCARGGDWIDESVARQFGTVPNRVTSIKENNTNLADYKQGSKKERLIREGIVYYYRNLISYTLDTIKQKLDNELANVDLPDALPIIVSGGTSKAKGFMDLFKNIVEDYDEFPFEVKEIRHAEDPLTAVAEGLLIKAISDYGDDDGK